MEIPLVTFKSLQQLFTTPKLVLKHYYAISKRWALQLHPYLTVEIKLWVVYELSQDIIEVLPREDILVWAGCSCTIPRYMQLGWQLTKLRIRFIIRLERRHLFNGVAERLNDFGSHWTTSKVLENRGRVDFSRDVQQALREGNGFEDTVLS